MPNLPFEDPIAGAKKMKDFMEKWTPEEGDPNGGMHPSRVRENERMQAEHAERKAFDERMSLKIEREEKEKQEKMTTSLAEIKSDVENKLSEFDERDRRTIKLRLSQELLKDIE